MPMRFGHIRELRPSSDASESHFPLVNCPNWQRTAIGDRLEIHASELTNDWA
jgi:hypothetical protein